MDVFNCSTAHSGVNSASGYIKAYGLFSGISFGLGGLTKLSPFLVAIPILGMVFVKHAKNSLKEAFLTTFKFLAGYIIPIIICLPWCVNYYNMVNTVTLNAPCM